MMDVVNAWEHVDPTSVVPVRNALSEIKSVASFTQSILSSTFTYDKNLHCFLYKSVDKKANPVPGILSEDAKVKRRFPEDPLATLPLLSPFPSDFSPSARLSEERLASTKTTSCGQRSDVSPSMS